ncbi:hypothetical protein ACFL08_05140 [Patescibacteria group bacterium]
MIKIIFSCFSCGRDLSLGKVGAIVTCGHCGDKFVINTHSFLREKLKNRCEVQLSCSKRKDCASICIKIRTEKRKPFFKTLAEANNSRKIISDHYNGRLIIIVEKGIDDKCSDCFFKTGCGFSIETFRKKAKHSSEIQGMKI